MYGLSSLYPSLPDSRGASSQQQPAPVKLNVATLGQLRRTVVTAENTAQLQDTYYNTLLLSFRSDPSFSQNKAMKLINDLFKLDVYSKLRREPKVTLTDFVAGNLEKSPVTQQDARLALSTESDKTFLRALMAHFQIPGTLFLDPQQPSLGFHSAPIIMPPYIVPSAPPATTGTSSAAVVAQIRAASTATNQALVEDAVQHEGHKQDLHAIVQASGDAAESRLRTLILTEKQKQKQDALRNQELEETQARIAAQRKLLQQLQQQAV